MYQRIIFVSKSFVYLQFDVNDSIFFLHNSCPEFDLYNVSWFDYLDRSINILCSCDGCFLLKAVTVID